MKRRPQLLWITDPWNTLDHPLDTTLRFAQEAASLGIKQFWCDVKSIRLERQVVRLDARPLLSMRPDRNKNSFEWGATEVKLPKDFTSIQYRTDPPVDLAFLHPLQLLGIGLKGAKNTEVVNPLEVLLSLNEKMEAAVLGELMPPSLVSSQWEQLEGFGKTLGRTVLKPLHQAQSQGIELLDWRNTDGIENAKAKVDAATQRFNLPVMLQTYLEGIADGEVRLWFLDGNLLAWAKKLPLTGDFRVNMDRGSRLSQHVLSRNERAKAQKIAKHLRARKIRLAAVDLIEGYVTDFNFTSPGLITQMESLLGENLSRPIVKALAR